MKIRAEVVIRATRYVIESDGVMDGVEAVKRVIAELESPKVNLKPSPAEVRH